MIGEMKKIDITAAQRKEVVALLTHYLPDTQVWAYGSRVLGTAKPSSDLDLVAFASPDQASAVADLKESFEESDLPFRVDLFVWDEMPETFQKNMEKAYAVLTMVKKGVGGE